MQQITQGTQTSRALLAGSGLPWTQSQSKTAQRAKGSLQGVHKLPKAAQTEQAETASSNGASANSTNPLDFDELTDIIRMVHDTDIVELELKSKKFSLAVRKKEAIEKPEPVYQAIPQAAPLAAAPSLPAPPPQAPAAPSTPPPSPAPQASSGSSGGPSTAGTVEVASPMSGTFYHSPAPGEPPFVKVGDRVTKGQTIGIIEAMKLMNEIEADSAGTIVEFTAPNGTSVAPGQSLVRIKP